MNWNFWIVVLEKALESPLDYKEIKPVNPEGNQPWIFIGWTAVEAEAPILWSPDAKSWLTGKDPDAGKDWRQEKGATEDEMVGWHQWLHGHELEQTPEDSEGQTGKPGVLQSMGLSRIGHNLVIQQQQQQQIPYLQIWLHTEDSQTTAAPNLVPSLISCSISWCSLTPVQFRALSKQLLMASIIHH